MLSHWRRDLGGFVWLFPVGLVLAVLAGYFAATSSASSFTSDRRVLFLTPPTASQEPNTQVNPFLAFSASLYTAAEVIALTVTDARVVEELAPEGSGIEYTVGMMPGTSAPVLTIEVKAANASQADSVADQLVTRIGSNLLDAQKAAKAPKSTWITSSLAAASAEPKRDWTGNLLLGIIAVCAVLALTLAALVLVIWLRRRRRPAEHIGVEASPGPDDPPHPAPG